jgi:myo-inositol-1(or 4)-monophosphatase
VASPKFFLLTSRSLSRRVSVSAYLDFAIEAAYAAGGLLRAHYGRTLTVDLNEAHDIKLELDRRSQALIESCLLEQFPSHAIYGEEGMRGDADSEFQWVIDPIDGTVNYFYGIPHFAISIALRQAKRIIVGVIYDPMRDELWSVEEGGVTMLNNRPVVVSSRTALSEAIVSVGMAKSLANIDLGLPLFQRMLRSAKKCRMMGSAALDIAYVACGRLDIYVEGSISLWDVAAGVLLLERAGGKVVLKPHETAEEKFSIVASNGLVEFEL